MRTVCSRGLVGPPLSAGSEETEASLLHVYVLVVLGTLACALLLGCLLKR